MNDNKDNLPKWDKSQIEAQKKINKRMAYRTAGALVITLAIIIIAIVVSFASCDRNSIPQKPASNASISKIQTYEQAKFADNNASSIDTITKSNQSKILIVKVDNVDASTNSSSSNSFSQLADELLSVGSYDAAKNGVIFYGSDPYKNEQGQQVEQTSFAVYFKQDSISSLNSGYSDYISNGNYDSLFKNADAYYLRNQFITGNKTLSKLPATKSTEIIEKSLALTNQQ
ncbi:hypothetical protein [Companilactobacillus ginsenosidimutans]|uniref:Uncharacterized protein n=1 Tax=Companilactobacillus ginsenosidimutans TaxID=1007676 RepID=A0A0H4QFJ5_9LACO|nr:hypothetical protein [Companilactobacillus ginsenosidimutans]AKP66732.1 hypothetical protein ABM34_03565 [Companilactobacillus ginsenosidimutans]